MSDKRRALPNGVLRGYALCRFANFSSIAIQIGGIGALAPQRRGDLAKRGLQSMIAGLIAGYFVRLRRRRALENLPRHDAPSTAVFVVNIAIPLDNSSASLFRSLISFSRIAVCFVTTLLNIAILSKHRLHRGRIAVSRPLEDSAVSPTQT